MRVWTLVSLITLGAGLVACKDDSADPIANDDIGWQVGCGGGGCGVGYNGHDQKSSEDKFDVECKDTDVGFEITLTDPGNGTTRPKSVLKVANFDPEKGSCEVSVEEAEQVGFNARTIVGSCADKSCTLTKAVADGWETAGLLKCTSLTIPLTSTSPRYTLTRYGSTTDPVQIAVDNCD